MKRAYNKRIEISDEDKSTHEIGESFRKEKIRKFRDQWASEFSWLENKNGHAFCKACQKFLINHYSHLKHHDTRPLHMKRADDLHINSTNETEDEIEAAPEECIANVSKTNLRENENNPLQELLTKKIPKKKTKSNDSVIDELRQTAVKSLELMNLFMRTRIEEREKEDSKEEAFCRMLCAELKGFKYENTYDQVTTELFALVRQAKANERELLTQNL